MEAGYQVTQLSGSHSKLHYSGFPCTCKLSIMDPKRLWGNWSLVGAWTTQFQNILVKEDTSYVRPDPVQLSLLPLSSLARNISPKSPRSPASRMPVNAHWFVFLPDREDFCSRSIPTSAPVFTRNDAIDKASSNKLDFSTGAWNSIAPMLPFIYWTRNLLFNLFWSLCHSPTPGKEAEGHGSI